MDPTLNCQQRTIILLRETEPDVAAVVEATGCGPAGEPMLGLMGWLPDEAFLALCKAALLAHRSNTDCVAHGLVGDPVGLAAQARHWGVCNSPFTGVYREGVEAGMRVWGERRIKPMLRMMRDHPQA